MDLSKAFDCIPHDLIIAKFKACVLNESALIDICVTKTIVGQKGVRQGCIMGPKVF